MNNSAVPYKPTLAEASKLLANDVNLKFSSAIIHLNTWCQRLCLPLIRRALLFCLFAAVSLPAAAQNLSEAEKAAMSKRTLSAEERSTRTKECKFEPKIIGRIKLTESLDASTAHLPALSFLAIATVVYEGPQKNTFGIKAYELLPNGGIGARDICEPIKIETFRRPTRNNDVILVSALRLRGGLNVAKDYPNTSKSIAADQLLKVSAGTYALLDLSDGQTKAWYTQQGGAWAHRTFDKPIGIILGDLIAIRVSE